MLEAGKAEGDQKNLHLLEFRRVVLQNLVRLYQLTKEIKIKDNKLLLIENL
jgi:hypothetical protein